MRRFLTLSVITTCLGPAAHLLAPTPTWAARRRCPRAGWAEGTGWALLALFLITAGGCAGEAPPSGGGETGEAAAPDVTRTDGEASPMDRLPDDRAGEVVARAIEAAGGWDRWQETRTVAYTKRTVHHGEDGETRTSADHHRYRLHPGPAMHIRWDDAEAGDPVMINDGDEAWKLVDGEVATGPGDRDQAWNATFGSHYMFSLPFKLTDEGAILDYEGRETLPDGRTADRVRVTYQEGAGSSGGLHTWTYFFTPEGELAAYYLQFGDGPEDYRFAEYAPPEEVGGLLLPIRRTVWRSNAAMEKVAIASEIHHDDIRFGVDLPDELFRPPAAGGDDGDGDGEAGR